MASYVLDTPVVFILFNRPDTTIKVFEEIRRARPPKLLVIADGPRPGNPDDAVKCAAARDVIKGVDWDCEVLTNFADTNMGCKVRVSSGLDWAFDTVEEAIVLEDDCLPHPGFFRFCEEMLDRYRDDERVGVVRGDNWPGVHDGGNYSYWFTIYPSIWGWASWRRVWKNYDVDMPGWPEAKKAGWLKDRVGTYRMARFWEDMFDSVYRGQIDTWDFQFVFSCWRNSQLSVMPGVNLVSNIGGGAGSTHTADAESPRLGRKLDTMVFPLRHPDEMVCRRDLDAASEFRLAKLEMRLRKYVYLVLKAAEVLYNGEWAYHAKRFSVKICRGLFRNRTKNNKIASYMSLPGPKKLNLGCGGNVLEGWLNSDVDQPGDVMFIDISRNLPMPDGSFEFVFAEHSIEHIGPEETTALLKEIRRILKPGGIVRLATPDMVFYASMLLDPDSPQADVFRKWYSRRSGVSENVHARLMNSLFYEHGHRFIFNEQLLRESLERAGFTNIRRFAAGESVHPELRGIEGHGKVPDVGEEINRLETLVLEAEVLP